MGKHDIVESIRSEIERMLYDETVFRESAMKSFKKLAADRPAMNLDELHLFFEKLCLHVSVPPIREDVILSVFDRFASADGSGLQFDAFLQMYGQILHRIRDRFYPPRIDFNKSQLLFPTKALGRESDLAGRIVFLNSLGSGSFGEVFLVRDLSVAEDGGANPLRACKKIDKARTAVPSEVVRSEVRILKEMDHPNVIRIYEIFEDDRNVYILQEYCEGGEVLSSSKIDAGIAPASDERSVRRIMKQIFQGLTHIHRRRVMHKDLKPENVLFATEAPDSVVKIIDFGLGELFTSEANMMTTVLRGSHNYMAPEAFSKHRVDRKSDIWAAGCIMYNLFTGKSPFEAADLEELRISILSKEVDLSSTCHHVSHEARDLLSWIFKKWPPDRCSAAAALEHPWFQESTKLSTVDLSESICCNMKKYSKQKGLRNLFMKMMAHQLSIKNEDVLRISNLFKDLDKRNRGVLSQADLKRALLKAGVTKYDVNLILQVLAVEGSGEISYREFLAACHSWRESELHLIWMAFQRLPRCGDGDKVSVSDLCEMLTRRDCNAGTGLGSPSMFREVKKKEIEMMIAEVDADRDGFIGWPEFESYIRWGTATAEEKDSIAFGSVFAPACLFEEADLPSTDCSM